jgi:DNA polymerase III subunit gamma/tau
MSLPNKYRPEKFSDLLGQTNVSQLLSELIRRGEGRSIVISGAWGCGKTSAARIYARALNCLHPTEDGDPCYQCEHCRDFTKGSFHDYHELDSATYGKVEEIPRIIEIAKTPPILGKWRVIVFDEAQSTSPKAFDALLKVLEEPPAFLVLIFLTTEVHKVRDAIKSRCASLQVHTISDELAKAYAEKTCKAEGIEYDEAGIDLIVHKSKGHPRDILKDLDQVAHYGKVTLERVKAVFGLTFMDHVARYVLALQKGDYPAQVEALSSWVETPQNIFVLLQEFFLYYYYRYVLRIETFIVNPILLLLPQEQWQEIHRGFLKKVQDIGSTSEEVFQEVNKLWTSRTNAGSLVELHYHLLALHNLLNVNGLRSTAVPAVASVAARPIIAGCPERSKRNMHRNREIPLQVPVSPVIQADPILVDTQVVAEKPKTTVFRHELASMGFGAPIGITEAEM